jgi:hypothetical protein
VNAGETAEIKWRFPPGAKLITYKKKSIQGDEVMIASKQGVGEPEMFNATESVIRVEKSGALSILKAGLKDEGFYEIAIAYNKGITLKDEVEIKIQGNILNIYMKYISPRPSVGVVVTSECTATSSYTEHKLNFSVADT